MSGEGVTAIVLAGGRSSRYGSDKLAATLEGRSLLERSVAVVAAVAGEVVVVVPPGGRADLPAGTRAVTDPEPYGGPLVGLLAGLAAAHDGLALVVAADMPWLEPAVLRLLLHELVADPDAGIALLAAVDEDRAERFPMALRVEPARAAARRLLDDGERRIAGLTDALVVRIVAGDRWTAVDPSGRTPRDVDRPGDLAGESAG